MSKLQELVAGVLLCDVESLPAASTPLRDTDGWDSLKHVMLVVGLEKQFGVKLSAEEVRSMASIDDICRVLKGKGLDV